MPEPKKGGPPRAVVAMIAAVVALVFGFQLARWTGPEPTPGAAADPAVSPHTHPGNVGPGAEVGGLSLSAAGYTLVPERSLLSAGRAQTLRFTVRGPDGAPVRSYARVNEAQLHLVLTRRDLTGYQHLHPTLGADGVWAVPITLNGAGPWRAIADFTAIGAGGAQVGMALGVDLTVAGTYGPQALPAPARESNVDGYTVSYEGTAQAGASVPLVFRVYRDGVPVSDLERYLGTLGHLVVLREGDVGYVHVHADPPSSTASVRFWLAAPSPGRYRMFFDFKFGGQVHTAAYTVVVA